MKTEFIWVKDIREYPNYYRQMFGIREIAKELGGDIYWNNCDEWILAVDGDDLLGFAGYDLSGSNFTFKRAYVFKKYRRLGVYKILFEMRYKRALELGAKTMSAKTTIMSRRLFEETGFFSLVKTPKKFVILRKIL